jgi:hypothetical protein
MKGMTVDFLKSVNGDSTNDGFSSKDYKGYLFAEGLDGPFSVREMGDMDYLVVVDGPFNTKRAVPKSILDSGVWYSFGGNFAYVNDTSFDKLNDGNPIKIFDRVESDLKERMAAD